MKYWIGVALGLALVVGLIMPIEARESRGGKRIEKMDSDKDGKISKDEWIAYYSEKFTEKDVDGDGYVTAGEMESSRRSRGGKRGSGGND